MKTTILGAYEFTSKNGKTLVNLSCLDERLNAFGQCSINLMGLKDSLPYSLDEMIGKQFVIDCRYGSNGSAFAQNFYEVK